MGVSYSPFSVNHLILLRIPLPRHQLPDKPGSFLVFVDERIRPRRREIRSGALVRIIVSHRRLLGLIVCVQFRIFALRRRVLHHEPFLVLRLDRLFVRVRLVVFVPWPRRIGTLGAEFRTFWIFGK